MLTVQEDAKIAVSKHATKRLKERSGLNKRATKRMAEKAFKNGCFREETKGELRFWLDERFYSHLDEGEREVLVYGDKAYVFSLPSKENSAYVLITVMQVPKQHLDHIDSYLIH